MNDKEWWFAVWQVLAVKSCRDRQSIIRPTRSTAPLADAHVHGFGLCLGCGAPCRHANPRFRFLADLDGPAVASPVLELW
jgi:hypothetical protein